MAEPIACLDIGTTKIGLLVAKPSQGGPEVLSLVSGPSRGIRKGKIIDMAQASLSIKKAVVSAENILRSKGSKFRITSVITGISGDSAVVESSGATGIGGRAVKEKDIDDAIKSAGSVYIPVEREILHAIAVDFSLDGEPGIRNPVGLKGYRLEARVQIITVPHIEIENISACLKGAGLRMEQVIFQGLATARAVLKEEEMEEGVLLIDIGGGTSEVIVIKGGRLLHSARLPVGGNHITNDLAIGLKVPLQEAERIKIKYGSATVRNSSEEIEIDISRSRRRIYLRIVDEIISQRAEEIVSLIERELSDIRSSGIVIPHAVITGGGSLLQGLDLLFESHMGIPVRIGYPLNLPQWKDPSLSAVAGLAEMAMEDAGSSSGNLSTVTSPLSFVRDLIYKIKNAFKGLHPGFIKKYKGGVHV